MFSFPIRFLAAITIVMAAVIAPATVGAADDVFFSEYVEGSGLFNKALEIFNPTSTAVDTAVEPIEIEIYENGASSPASSIFFGPASGVVIGPGETFVTVQFSADQELTDRADDLTLGLSFDGNDAVVLRRNGAIVDVIGQIGVDPGAGGWGMASTSTTDHTLRRQSTVCAGDTDGQDGFDPAGEWEGFALDVFDGVGAHVADCAATPTDVTPWGALKARYR